MSGRHIHSMGSAQSERVRAAILPASRDWARTRSYVVGSITLGGAIADLNRDCYIGVVDVVLFHRGSHRYDGTLTWDVDHTFKVATMPAIELAGAGGWTSPELERVDAQLRLQPTDADLLQARGYRLHELGRYEEALSALDASLRRNPQQPGAQYWRGRTLSRLDRNDDALVALEESLREDPGNPAALQALGITLHSLYRYAESLAAHDASIAADPSDANAHCLHGWTLDDLGRTEDAIGAYEAALRIAPTHLIAMRRRALALLRAGRTEDAVAALEAAVAVLPDDQELASALDGARNAKKRLLMAIEDDWDGNFVSASASMRANGLFRLREWVTTQEHADMAQVGRTLAALKRDFEEDVDTLWAALTAERQELHPEWPALEPPVLDATTLAQAPVYGYRRFTRPQNQDERSSQEHEEGA